MRTAGAARLRRLRADAAAAVQRQLRDLPPGRRLRLRLALAAIEHHAGGREDVRVLDAGSEEGLLCLALARGHPSWLLVAADIAAAPLRRGAQWAAAEGTRVLYVRCDLQQPVGVATYDVVAALESLVEIPDDRAALRWMAVALRPGGLFLAHVPTADWTPVLRSAERTWRREARHGYDPGELTAALEALGLEVRSVEPVFRRLTALAQDVRDRNKARRRAVQLALLPLMAGAVALERHGVTWGPPRGLFVVAVRN